MKDKEMDIFFSEMKKRVEAKKEQIVKRPLPVDDDAWYGSPALDRLERDQQKRHDG
tara:strand:- start:323 stop:490 length:168 start_codon:yes stop_codon:yes gene_type:complete